jgi:hypothetical protein
LNRSEIADAALSRKEKNMKKWCLFATVAMVFVLVFSVAQAQEYGKIRALQERAASVTKQKNDFVVRVLKTYNIPHEVNGQGVVVRINMDNQWMDIRSIEIIPVLKESSESVRQVAAHELFFFTDNGILHVISELKIR